jgi:membrane protein
VGGAAILRDTEKKLDSQLNDVRVPMTGGRLGLADLVKRTGAQLGTDHTMAFAKSIAFSGLLAIFPLLLFTVMVLGVFHADGFLLDMLDRARSTMPNDAYRLLKDTIIPTITDGHSARLSIGAAFTILLSLWGISGAMRDLMEGMNVMYGVRDTRGLVKRYGISLLLALATAILFLAAAVLVVAGNDIADAVAQATGTGDALRWTWMIAQWPTLAALVLLAFALIYSIAPNVEQPFRYITPGALIGFVLWLAFTGLFAVYANTFGSYSKTYGALAGVIVVMLYLLYSSAILLIGAEINQVIEDAAPGDPAG